MEFFDGPTFWRGCQLPAVLGGRWLVPERTSAPSTLRPLLVGVGLAVLQQFSGINSVIFYCGEIFAGVFSKATADAAAVGVQGLRSGLYRAASYRGHNACWGRAGWCCPGITVCQCGSRWLLAHSPPAETITFPAASSLFPNICSCDEDHEDKDTHLVLNSYQCCCCDNSFGCESTPLRPNGGW